MRLLTRAQAIQAAQRAGVSGAERLLDLGSAAWRIAGCADRSSATVLVGGDPSYLDDESWPTNEHGARLSLIARIDAGRLPALRSDWWPVPRWHYRDARLDVFADRDYGGLKVVLLQRPAEDDLASEIVGGVMCEALPCLSLPTLGEESFDDDLEAEDRYAEWRHAVAYDDRPPYPPVGISTLLGEPHSLHDDGVLERTASRHRAADQDAGAGLGDPAQWRVLLQLATDPDIGFDFGGGVLTIALPVSDLAAGRYDRAVAEWQF